MKKQKDQAIKRIGMRFPADLVEALAAMAKQHERSLHSEIIYALREYAQKEQKKK